MFRLSRIYTGFKRYLANCNIHGIRYTVEHDLHWTERLFWLITCTMCWFGCMLMVRDSLDGYYNRSVAVTAESMYLDWEVDFPAVSVCMNGHQSAMDIAGALYKQKFGRYMPIFNALNWLYTDTPPLSQRRVANQFSLLNTEDVIHLYKGSSRNCTQIMNKCYWRSSLEFHCCDEFLPLRTAAGVCYVFNSRHTEAGVSSNRFVMNQNTGIGSLSIGIESQAFQGRLATIRVFVSNNLIIPTAVSNSDREISINFGEVSSAYFTLEDTFNEPGLNYLPPERRKCRFSRETQNFHSYKLYSNSGCLIQLLMENMMKFCGCVSHLFPYRAESTVCNYTGVECLYRNAETISPKHEANVVCLPDCEGTVMRIYQNRYGSRDDPSKFKISQGIHLEPLALPTSRYKRYVVRSLLDLVVAVGSTAGLFMGAGILSLVEIPYWLLLRHDS